MCAFCLFKAYSCSQKLKGNTFKTCRVHHVFKHCKVYINLYIYFVYLYFIIKAIRLLINVRHHFNFPGTILVLVCRTMVLHLKYGLLFLIASDPLHELPPYHGPSLWLRLPRQLNNSLVAPRISGIHILLSWLTRLCNFIWKLS